MPWWNILEEIWNVWGNKSASIHELCRLRITMKKWKVKLVLLVRPTVVLKMLPFCLPNYEHVGLYWHCGNPSETNCLGKRWIQRSMGAVLPFLWALAEEVHAIPQYIAINVPVHFARFSKRQEVRKTSREGNIKDIEDKKETWQPRSRKGFIPVRRRQSSSNFEPTTNYFFKLSKVSHWL